MPVSCYSLRSPSQRIEVSIELDAGGRPTYRITFDGKPLIVPSSLGVRLAGGQTLSHGFGFVRVARSSVDRQYTLIAGKTRLARDHHHQLRLELENADRQRLHLIFRAYDDGTAFRYRIPAQDGQDVIAIEDELTCFGFAADYDCWGLNLRRFDTGHEGEFRPMRASTIRNEDLLDMPLVCQTSGAVFAIAEADLKDYAGMYLRGADATAPGVQVRLSPRLDDPAIAVRGQSGADLLSPWRVVMIADRAGDLIHSTLITSLNPPSRIRNPDWIKPGKYAWDWWCDSVVSGVTQPGMNDSTIQRFIDFAAETKLQYMLIDAGWYVSGEDGEGGSAADVTRSIPAINLPAL